MRIHTKTVCRLTDDPNEYLVLQDEGFEYSGRLDLADRAIQGAAEGNAKTAGDTAAGYGSSAAGIGSTVVPTLTRDVTNPTGFTPTEKNQQLVASQQGAGGATAGVTGAAGLAANRTRNSSALSSVLDQAARTKQQALSQNTLGIQTADAKLAQQKRQQALGGLEGLYGTDVGAQLKSMGIQDQDLSTAISAGNSGWLQNADSTITALSGAAKTGGQIATGNYGP
jgi:hypothetical protein